MNAYLHQYWNQWIFYKRLMVAFFALNVFSVIVSVVLSVSYWNHFSDSPQQVKELIAVGGLTLTFGIILPLYVLLKIGLMMDHARRELERAARDIAQEWMRQFEKYDQDPFKNVDFWMNAVLLSAEQVGRYYKHPMANFGGELAGLVRLELNKIRKDNNENHGDAHGDDDQVA